MSPTCQSKKVDFVLFSDNENIKAEGWQVKPIDRTLDILRGDLINRYYKFFPSIVLPRADFSIYVDGNLHIKSDLMPMINTMVQENAVLGCAKHSQRKTIAEEVEVCLKLGKFKGDDYVRANLQLESYMKQQMPLESPLCAAGILVRNQRSSKLLPAMQLWWNEINKYTARDQISLPFVLWKTGLPYHQFDFNVLGDNPYFKRNTHRKNVQRKESPTDKLKSFFGRFFD